MKQIKYFLIILTSLLLGNISLADDPVELRIPDTTAQIGDFIDIPIYVDNSLTGENVFAYQFKIYYYDYLLSFISIETAGTISQSWGAPAANANTTNYLNIAGAGASPLAGTGVLLYIRFQCIGSGWSPLYFNGGSSNNFFNEGTPAVLLDDGFVSINALPVITVSPNSGLLVTGEQLQFYISGGTAPYTWDVTNPAVAGIDASGLLTATSHGFTKVTCLDNNGIYDESNDFIEIRAMQVSIHDTSAWQGSTIDIPIYTTSLTGLNIMSGNISFSFNQNILTPTTLITAGTMLDGYTTTFNNLLSGNVNIAFAGTTALSGSGVLLYVRFDVSAVSTGATWLNFTEAVFNENLLATTDNGYFTMST